MHKQPLLNFHLQDKISHSIDTTRLKITNVNPACAYWFCYFFAESIVGIQLMSLSTVYYINHCPCSSLPAVDCIGVKDSMEKIIAVRKYFGSIEYYFGRGLLRNVIWFGTNRTNSLSSKLLNRICSTEKCRYPDCS